MKSKAVKVNKLRKFLLQQLAATLPFLALLAWPSTSGAEGFSRLEAISLVETADDDTMVGRDGEVSRYQIMPYVWREYSSSTNYQDLKVSSAVAQKHIAWLENFYRRKTGKSPSEFDLYVMWNAGPGYYSKRQFSPDRVAEVVRERAQRFANLREMNLDLQAKAGARE